MGTAPDLDLAARRPGLAAPMDATAVLAENRLLVTQPGVKAVECLDPETGRLIWRRVLSDVRRVLGVANGIAVVQTETALMAFGSRVEN